MANYDAGHYFLTVAAPIDRNGEVKVAGKSRSLINNLHDTLSQLSTSQQDLVEANRTECCFARLPGTHFVRFFVLGDVRYNGRRPSNPIYDLIFNVQMTVAEKVDHLPDAYLIMTIDFDAPDGSEASLRAYTDSMWHLMSEEATLIFGHCLTFDEVDGSDGFFDFIKRCQINTTMPFSDYWTSDPPISNPLPLFAGLAVGFPVLALLAWERSLWTWNGWGLVGLTVLAVMATIIGITVKRGLTPFPAAPDSDIESVLKAVYIQQMFTGFMTDNLGRGGKDLYDAFQTFRETHRPANLSGPTQPSGVLKSERVKT